MICIYCQCEEGSSRDHVPPKQMLRKPYPPNLFTVPSCEKCNQSYSKDEEYFRLVILGLLCHTPEAEMLFDGPLSRSMDRYPVLEELMFESLSTARGGVALDVDYNRILRVALKIAKGLSFAAAGILQRPEISYAIEFGEVDQPGSAQRFGPDFTYIIHNALASNLEFTFYQSVRFRVTPT
jgi:hypothetical protein